MLAKIAQDIVDAEEIGDAYVAIQAYKKFLQKYDRLDLAEEANRTNYILSSGEALGTSWAAMCMDDFLRTQRFIKGLYQAIKMRLALTLGPLRVLYAGTGPFATLALPQLALFSGEEVNFHLLEVNSCSLAHAENVIKDLGFAARIEAFVGTDATTYQIPKHQKPDIIITETMQTALLKEQQVPISLHLLSQVDDQCVLIPQSIRLKIGLWNGVKYQGAQETGKNTLHLGTFFTLDRQTTSLPTYAGRREENQQNYRFLPKRIKWPQNQIDNFKQLVVFTEIDIFENQGLSGFDSGISLPYILSDVDQLEQDAKYIELQYLIDEQPQIKYVWTD